jgi:hypothetical protein
MTNRTTAEECRAVAADYRGKANRTPNPVRRSKYEALAKRWMKVAERFDRRDRSTGSNVLLFKRPHNTGGNTPTLRVRPTLTAI